MALFPSGIRLPFFLKVLTPRPRPLVADPPSFDVKDEMGKEGMASSSTQTLVPASGSFAEQSVCQENPSEVSFRIRSTSKLNDNNVVKDIPDFSRSAHFSDAKEAQVLEENGLFNSDADCLSSPLPDLNLPDDEDILVKDFKEEDVGRRKKRKKRKHRRRNLDEEEGSDGCEDDREWVPSKKEVKKRRERDLSTRKPSARQSERLRKYADSDMAVAAILDDVDDYAVKMDLMEAGSVEDLLKVELKDETDEVPDAIQSFVETYSLAEKHPRYSPKKKNKKCVGEKNVGEEAAKKDGTQKDNKKKRKKYKKPTEKRHACDFCEFRTHVRENLKRHLTIHTGERLFACDICDARFASKGEMTQHKKTHSGEKPYICEICGQAFTRSSHMLCHKRRHDGAKGDDGLPLKLYYCENCGKGFTSPSTLTMHKKRHTGERSHRCHICGLAFMFSSDLSRHIRRHAPKKPFPCADCPRVFATSHERKVHAARHTGEKPYPCNTCGASFARKTHLENHLRIHTGVRPYTCDQCGRPFTQRGTLTNHIKNIHEKNVNSSITTASETDYIGEHHESSISTQDILPGSTRIDLPPFDVSSAVSNSSSPLVSMYSNLSHIAPFIPPDVVFPVSNYEHHQASVQ